MNLLKEFFQTTAAKRFAWTILNVAMGMIVAFLTFAASDNIEWAVAVLPVATALSQLLTKYLNQ